MLTISRLFIKVHTNYLRREYKNSNIKSICSMAVCVLIPGGFDFTRVLGNIGVQLVVVAGVL